MLPKDITDKIREEAESLYPVDYTSKLIDSNARPRLAYIKGRTEGAEMAVEFVEWKDKHYDTLVQPGLHCLKKFNDLRINEANILSTSELFSLFIKQYKK